MLSYFHFISGFHYLNVNLHLKIINITMHVSKMCEIKNCNKIAVYGEYFDNPLRCKTHRENYKLVSRLCRGYNCKLRPSYGYKNDPPAKYCKSHKLDDMVNIVNHICEYDGCNTLSTFGYNINGKNIYKCCALHKIDGMVDIKSKKCEYDGCHVRPSYNYRETQNAKYCLTHKLDGMVNILSKKCEYDECNVQPSYNYAGQTCAKFCKTHKLENMVRVVNKSCIFKNCKTFPSFNYDGEKCAVYCARHKLESMVNVSDKRCEHIGCLIIPSYNYENELKLRFCKVHKLDGMVNIKSKKCKYLNCDKQPNYNYANLCIGRFCTTHKLAGMVDVKSKKCEHLNCNKIAHYNYAELNCPIFCASHKLDNMINIKEPKCKANFCLGTKANSKYDGYCASCFQQLFPNKMSAIKMRYKTKELVVRDYINSAFDGFQHDTTLWTGNCDCTHRRRIDHRKLINNTLLCIETDEFQHKFYDKNDEEIRYDDLFMLHGGKFIYIRFNPDKFKNKYGKTCNPMLSNRLEILREEIEKQINRIQNEENIELLEIIKLFYDEELINI